MTVFELRQIWVHLSLNCAYGTYSLLFSIFNSIKYMYLASRTEEIPPAPASR